MKNDFKTEDLLLNNIIIVAQAFVGVQLGQHCK